MSDIQVGDRVKVIEVPSEEDNDLLGMEGVVQPLDFAAALIGFDYVVVLDNQPSRFAEGGLPADNFFFEGELELA